MTHIATLLLACLALSACGDRAEEPPAPFDVPDVY